MRKGKVALHSVPKLRSGKSKTGKIEWRVMLAEDGTLFFWDVKDYPDFTAFTEHIWKRMLKRGVVV